MSSQETFRVHQRSLDVLQWGRLMEEMASRARSHEAQSALENLHPGTFAVSESVLRAQAVLELRELKREQQLVLPATDCDELQGLLKRISRLASIDVTEFSRLVRFHKSAQNLIVFLSRYTPKAHSLKEILSGLENLEEWARKHFPLLTPQGDIADSASDDLRALRKLAGDLHEQIKKRLDDYLHNPKLNEPLQDHYVTLRDGRYVLPIKTNFRGRVPGIIHDVSHSESTLFVEPQEVVDWNNQLKVTEKEIEKEIEKILAEVVEGTQPLVEVFQKNLEKSILAETLAAVANFIEGWGEEVTLPSVGETLHFVKLRHPLLMLSQKVIPNSLSWEEALVLTGPNTGGKTVLLKSIGLAVCLARAGIPLPAESAALPSNVMGLFADIGDDQDLEAHLSTFSGHLLVLKEMLETSQPGDLCLVDEIASGTSPEEGQPLAQAFIEEALSRKMRLLVTTHYGLLKQFAMTDPRLRIAAMSFDSVKKVPLYEIVLDIPGTSSAFETAEALGLPSTLIERAYKLRAEPSEDLRVALKRLEDARVRLQQREHDVEAALKLAQEREQKAQQKVLDYEAKQKESLGLEAREVLKKIHQLRDELAQAVKNAGSDDLRVGATQTFTKISEGAEYVRTLAHDKDKQEALLSPLTDNEIYVDAVVEVEGLGIGTLVEVPKNFAIDQKALFSIQVGDIRTRVSRVRLKRPPRERLQSFMANRQASHAAKERKQNQFSSKSAANGATSGNIVCDVRGRTVEDALRRVEMSLNEILRDENTVITIVHGHGSDKLKDSIRDYLKHKRDDVAFRTGSWPGEGGDGVTVVEKSHA